MNTYLVTIPVETLYMMLDYLSFEDIVNVCNSNLKLSFICQDDRFWADKAYHDYNFPKETFYEMQGTPIERYAEIDCYKSAPIRSFEMLISEKEINLNVIKAILPYLIDSINKNINPEGHFQKIMDSVIENDLLPVIKLFIEYNNFPTAIKEFKYIEPYYILNRAAVYGYIDIGIYILNNFGNKLYQDNPRFLWGPIQNAGFYRKQDFLCLLIDYAKKHKIDMSWINSLQYKKLINKCK